MSHLHSGTEFTWSKNEIATESVCRIISNHKENNNVTRTRCPTFFMYLSVSVSQCGMMLLFVWILLSNSWLACYLWLWSQSSYWLSCCCCCCCWSLNSLSVLVFWISEHGEGLEENDSHILTEDSKLRVFWVYLFWFILFLHVNFLFLFLHHMKNKNKHVDAIECNKYEYKRSRKVQDKEEKVRLKFWQIDWGTMQQYGTISSQFGTSPS